MGKLLQKLLEKFTSLEPTKALTVSIVASVAISCLLAFPNMGAESFIIYPISGVGAWFYGLKRLPTVQAEK